MRVLPLMRLCSSLLLPTLLALTLLPACEEEPTPVTLCQPLSAEESVCNGRDDDCDDLIDEGVTFLFYTDADQDGYGDPATEQEGCELPEGCTTLGGDCQDQDNSIFPNQLETLDGIDNDCNQLIDEGSSSCATFLQDSDLDGYGVEGTERTLCNPGAGWSRARGDCNDADAYQFPGAPDTTGDGIDSDCGGLDSPQPHVGLNSGSLLSIQDAIDLADEGTRLWIGPGIYLEQGLMLTGKALSLLSTHFQDLTFLDAQQLTPVLTLEDTGELEAVVDGFTFQHGQSYSKCFEVRCYDQAGGLQVTLGKASIHQCTFQENSGSGVAIRDSEVLLTDSLFTASNGRAATILGGTGSLTRITITDNQEAQNGGLKIDSGRWSLTDALLYNTAGGIDVSSDGFLMDQVEISHCDMGTSGHIIQLEGAGNIIRHLSMHDNVASAGLSLFGTNAVVEHTQLIANEVTEWLLSAPYTVTIRQSNFLQNRLTTSYVLLSATSATSLIENCLIESLGYPVGPAYEESAAQFRYNVLLDPLQLALLPPGWDSTNQRVDPQLLFLTNNLDATDDVLLLSPDSPLIDAGNPSLRDDDGTRSDIGVWGGAGANRSDYADADKDGLTDLWEQHFGLSVGTNDATQDLDGDGLNNRAEFDARLNPASPDTDQDGATDPVELESDSNANDWYAQPGIEGIAEAVVPGDFATLQAAINAAQQEGNIAMTAGDHYEHLQSFGKKLSIRGETGAVLRQPLNDALTRPLFLISGSAVSLSKLTLQDSTSTALYALNSQTQISDSTFQNNATAYGHVNGTLQITHSRFLQNTLSLDVIADAWTFNDNQVLNGGPIYLNQGGPRWNDSEPQAAVIGNTIRGGSGSLQLTGDNIHIAYNLITETYTPDIYPLPTVSVFGTGALVEHNLLTDNTNTCVNGYNIYATACISGFFFYLYEEPSTDALTTLVRHNYIWNNNKFAIISTLTKLEIEYNVIQNDVILPFNLSATNYGYPSPALVAYSKDQQYTNDNFHNALTNLYTNKGDPSFVDLDGSPVDIGLYGGLGASRDRDHDLVPDYFWPGTLGDAPEGFSPEDYDLNDWDPTVQ